MLRLTPQMTSSPSGGPRKRFANLMNEQLNIFSSASEDWFYDNCVNDMFPFSDLTDQEIFFLFNRCR